MPHTVFTWMYLFVISRLLCFDILIFWFRCFAVRHSGTASRPICKYSKYIYKLRFFYSHLYSFYSVFFLFTLLVSRFLRTPPQPHRQLSPYATLQTQTPNSRLRNSSLIYSVLIHCRYTTEYRLPTDYLNKLIPNSLRVLFLIRRLGQYK